MKMIYLFIFTDLKYYCTYSTMKYRSPLYVTIFVLVFYLNHEFFVRFVLNILHFQNCFVYMIHGQIC